MEIDLILMRRSGNVSLPSIGKAISVWTLVLRRGSGKFDSCSDTIVQAAPDARKVYLYSHGNTAVLKGWTSDEGIARLTKLEELIVEIRPQVKNNEKDCNASKARFQDRIGKQCSHGLPEIDVQVVPFCASLNENTADDTATDPSRPSMNARADLKEMSEPEDWKLSSSWKRALSEENQSTRQRDSVWGPVNMASPWPRVSNQGPSTELSDSAPVSLPGILKICLATEYGEISRVHFLEKADFILSGEIIPGVWKGQTVQSSSFATAYAAELTAHPSGHGAFVPEDRGGR
ncbi:hypothetical protein BP00DRAFT_412513 [Aspergillus indologenus CBS 114.80]|uniref:Uncharacterized protein n=1 Tax=Aspergillus indologenus CBS 114.80 TaxID=1450541 RepID=A0A2V5IE11_9EURO|nr:hypothetical protein BP00DRAFT_412513 [Aspergillus indologenus CBS 114.80]